MRIILSILTGIAIGFFAALLLWLVMFGNKQVIFKKEEWHPPVYEYQGSVL